MSEQRFREEGFVNPGQLGTLPACVKAANTILQNMNDQTSPCDDFYEFACGSYKKTRVTSGVLDVHRETGGYVNVELKYMMDKLLKQKTIDRGAEMVRVFYQSCMDKDTDARIKQKKEMVIEMLESVGDGESVRKDLSSMQKVLEGVIKKVAEVYSEVVNDEKQSRISKDIEDLMTFISKIANISATQTERRDVSKQYNTMTYGEFKRNFSGYQKQIDWDMFFQNAFGNALRLRDTDLFNVENVTYFQKLPNILSETSKKVLSNYMIVRMIFPVLQKSVSNNWASCLQSTASALMWPLSALYIKESFDKNLKNQTRMILQYIRIVAEETIKTADWTDDYTRESALKKLRFLKDKIAYPELIFDQNRILRPYGDIKLSNTSYIENLFKIGHAKRKYMQQHFREAPDRTDWQDATSSGTVLEVNAFYATQSNEMQFNIAQLLPPFLVSRAPKYINFGGLGSIIGHELNHAYDDQGALFDFEGHLNNWWSDTTKKKFKKKSQCFVDQYSDIIDPITKMRVNGKMALGENIADNGGVYMAYEAYKKWKTENLVSEQDLPGLEKFTGDQLFIISYANTWCGVMTEKTTKFLMDQDHIL